MRRITVGSLVLVLLASLSWGTGQMKGLQGLGLSLSSQPESPIRVLSTTHRAGGGYSILKVANVSDKMVEAVAFGAFVVAREQPQEPIFYETGLLPVELTPTGSSEVSAFIIPATKMTEIATRFTGGADAQAGVTRVRFSDGGVWSYDPRQHGGFSDRQDNAGNMRACGFTALSFGAVLRAAGFQAHYECVESANQEYCTNEDQGTSCTNTLCETGQPCPKQKCEIRIGG